MTLFPIGRMCMKLAGRDAGRKCVVVETVDNRFVIVDGNVRRKKVNTRHLEPLTKMIEIKSKASHNDVKSAFEKMGEAVWERKSKKPAARPRLLKKKREVVETKPVKKPVKDKISKKEEIVKPVEVPKEVVPEVQEKEKEVSTEVPVEKKE